MFKKLLLCAILISTVSTVHAQRYRGGNSCNKFYIGVSSGINNSVGLVGVNFDVPIVDHFSLGTGVGLSSWGYKSFVEGRYYFGECHRGWALGVGATYNTGINDIATTLPTVYQGETDVLMDWEPVPAAFFSAYHFFNLGRAGHRFHLQLGWSQRFDDEPYTVKSNHILSSDAKTVMGLLAPGGIIFGFGFTFGIGG